MLIKECPTDCKWSEWGSWSRCSKTCGKGKQERKRIKTQEAQNGGAACVSSNKQTQYCINEACPGGKPPYTYLYCIE